MAEVPTVAIHDISITENDTIFPDEYIAHRLGLVPLLVDPSLLDRPDGDGVTDSSTLYFRLNVRNDTSSHLSLYSNHIVWVPRSGQEHFQVQVQPDVLICKMSPGNTVDMEISAQRGTGAQHAKWSPVSLCSYRLMPRIVLKSDVFGADAQELKSCFSPGVIEIVNDRAVVANPRLESMSREVLRHDKFADSVELLREPGWFCFTVESVALEPLALLKMSLLILKEKCKNLRDGIAKIQ